MVSISIHVNMGGATKGCGGDNVPLTFAACTSQGVQQNSNSTNSHYDVSTTVCSQNALFQTFPAEIDGIRSTYYHTRNALKPTYSHLRSQNFPGEKPRTPHCMPQRYHSNPPYKCIVTGLQYCRTTVSISL